MAECLPTAESRARTKVSCDAPSAARRRPAVVGAAAVLACWALLAGAPVAAAAAKKEARSVILATTTSTQDSGLLDVLIPVFEKETGYLVKTISVGSGQAIAMGRRGEADVLLVHSPADEQQLVDEGHGLNRRLVMHNDFVLVGPPSDPAAIRGATSSREALKRIAGAGATFLSRGDGSGTHSKEKAIWKAAGIEPEGQGWYQQTGLGMGDTLNVASEKGGYTLADRGTYLARSKARPLALEILFAGEPLLLNVYHVLEVSAARWPKVNAAGAKAFADFMVSARAQELIGRFGVDRIGSPLFIPDAGKKAAGP
jgi:tungstate transport system substrate-binding protein